MMAMAFKETDNLHLIKSWITDLREPFDRNNGGEAKASQARYSGMDRVAPVYAEQKICTPHTWHAAEAFLYLLEKPE